MQHDEVRNLPGVRDALWLTEKEGVNEEADFDCRITETGSSAMELRSTVTVTCAQRVALLAEALAPSLHKRTQMCKWPDEALI